MMTKGEVILICGIFFLMICLFASMYVQRMAIKEYVDKYNSCVDKLNQYNTLDVWGRPTLNITGGTQWNLTT